MKLGEVREEGGSKSKEKQQRTPACNFTEKRKKNLSLGLDGGLALERGIIFQINPILSLHKLQTLVGKGQVLTFLKPAQRPL